MKKVVKRTLSGTLCAILAVCLYLGSVIQEVQAGIIANNASADTKKVYTEKDSNYKSGTAENPLTILEIVPNHSMAKIGYLIPGCEPIDMNKLKTDDTVFGTYRSMFATSNNGEETAVTVEDVDLIKFADQLPSKATVREPWQDKELLKSMAPADINWVTQETNFGMWRFVINAYTETGYYQYVEDGTGYFNLENRDTAPEFVYDENHKGSYNWVEAENAEGITTDYTADQVWTTRTSNYYFEYKERDITNNDLLIKNTFDTSSQEGFVSQVITLTPEELNSEENLKLIDTVDLIVIGQDAETDIRKLWNAMRDDEDLDPVDENAPTKFSQNDVSWAAVKRIVERMASENPAALILDKTTYDNGWQKSTNLTKLAIMLLQYDPALFMDCYFDKIDGNGTYTDSNKVAHAEWVCSEYPEQNTFDLNLAKNKNINLEAGNGVIADNIYAYNGYNIFTHGYGDKKYSETTLNKEAFDYFEEINGSRPEVLSASEFVQYILNGGKRYKKSMRILEVEPTNSFIYPGDDYIDTARDDSWVEYYRALIPWMKGDLKQLVKNGKIEIITMPSWEFIGKIEDLNAEYDMIVFGPKQNKANGSEGYNDKDMDGLIYSSIGDKVLKNASAVRKFHEMQSGEAMRYSGNDLTEKKFVEVKNFLKGGKPVVVDSAFYTKGSTGISTNTVDKVTVDESSYAYQLFALKGTEEGRNIFVTDRLDMSEMKKVLSRENCEIEFYTADGGKGYPIEYKYETKSDGSINGDTVTYVDSRTFAYQFRINGTQSQNYRVKLYIDRNGDGIYKGSLKENVLGQNEDESEEIEGLTVTDMYGNPVDANNLKAGVWYRVSKELPANYLGILPWKLEVCDTANTMIRDNVVKYSAIKTTAENREKIKVLQMNLVVNLGTNDSQPDGVVMATEGYKSDDLNAKKFQKYLGAVNDFDVTVEVLSNKAWNQMFGKGSNKSDEEKIEDWKAYLDEYDMLMIGYMDVAQFTSNNVFQAGFEYFVSQNKSVILSHDIVKDESYKWDSGVSGKMSNYDDNIRDLLSQRRYNSSYVKLKDKEVALVLDQTLKDHKEHNNDITSLTTTNENGELVPNYGDNSTNFYVKYGPNSNSNNKGAKSDRDCHTTNPSFPSTTTYVNINNSGQITNYPYTLGSVIKVANTHAQYTQLNLDDEDMVVWYSLTDWYSKDYADEVKQISGSNAKGKSEFGRGLYSSRESDVRNNFYIYNIGNITYTGMGHSGYKDGATLPDDEVKLFVNTMISSYRATSDNPYAEVTNADKVENSKNDVYLYVPMDEANFDYTNENIQVKFKITDPSWLQTQDKDTYLQFTTDKLGTEPLTNQMPLYLEGTGNLAGTTELTSKDRYVYLKKPANWSDNISCYIYSGIDESNKNASWPGVEMEKVNGEGLYRCKVPSSIISPLVIFTDGRSQYPGQNQPGLSYSGSSMIADGTKYWNWTAYPEEKQQAYQVDVDGSYYFNVSYQELINQGQLEYYLCLKSSYKKNGNTVMNKEVTKVTVLPMPLFDLN